MKNILLVLILVFSLNSFADQKCEQYFAKTPQRLSIKDQKCNPACTWFARTSLFEEAIYQHEGKIVNLSAEAYLARYLTEAAIWRAEYNYNYFTVQDQYDAQDYARRQNEYRFVQEKDWALSPEFANNGIERFAESVTEILQSKMPKEDKIENINAASVALFGQKISGEDYIPQFRNIRLSVEHEIAWFKKPKTYKDLTTDPTIEIMQETTVSEGMNIIDRTLKEGRPVKVGLRWDWEREDQEKGILSVPFYKDLKGGTHAVLIYKKDWLGRYHFINSWGTDVGQKGHYYMTRGYLKKALLVIEVLIPKKPTE